MKLTIALIAFALVIFFFPELATAQPGLPNAPAQSPIDGGLALLAAAGGGYAIKKLRDRKE